MAKLNFIINGEVFVVGIDTSAPLAHAVDKALTESNNTGRRDVEQWEVREARGVLLEKVRPVAAMGLKDGQRLFLSLGVGAGG